MNCSICKHEQENCACDECRFCMWCEKIYEDCMCWNFPYVESGLFEDIPEDELDMRFTQRCKLNGNESK